MRKFTILFSCIFVMLFASKALSQVEQVHIEGAIILEDSDNPNPVPGTVRWTGLDYEGWDGWNWVTLTGTSSRGGVYDIDSNFYKTVHLGSRIWMAENLRVTRFNDGNPINIITDDSAWSTTNAHGMSIWIQWSR